MNARRAHPTLEVWLAWIDGAVDDDGLREHLVQCASCRALTDTLRISRDARARGIWAEPSDDVLARAFGARTEAILPRARRPRGIEWQAADVRSGGDASVADDAKIVAGSCAGGEISVLVHPPLRDASWHFEARVWLRDAATDARAVIGLVHGEHVLQQLAARDGETVRFDEVVAGGWALEIHLPNGESVVLRDPFGTE